MKLTSFYIGDRSSYGIVTDTGVIDLGCLPDAPDNLRQALSQLGVDGVKALGHKLMDPYVVTLEVLALLLTAALIGAVAVAQGAEVNKKEDSDDA